jgi:cyclase
MEIIRVSPQITAFIGGEGQSNSGFIQTPAGIALVDTTDDHHKMLAWLKQARLTPDDVSLVINTHFHADHVWGNQLFHCPILAHRLCHESMIEHAREDWTPALMEEYAKELEKANPSRAAQVRSSLEGFTVKLPTQTFEDRQDMDMGGTRLEIIHLGGHTPCSSIVWVPSEAVLFSGDLIFTERYPYVFSATSITDWIAALDQLRTLQPVKLIPGHGSVCTLAEVDALRAYFETTRALVREHASLGHSPEETADDPLFPRYSELGYERSHKANIRWMVERAQLDPDSI